jgi:nicotinate-nucleotide pyrophosphorylase (carboxylating)
MASYIKIKEFMTQTLLEDIGRGDLFASLAPDCDYQAYIVAKQDGILSGIEYIKVFCEINNIETEYLKNDGDEIKVGDKLLNLKAKAKVLLECERTILNTLQHSSGIATNTNKTVKLLEDSGITLLDTRKTRPLLREFEKYSTKVGGAINHRMGLDDSLMIKDTHLKTIDNIEEFIKKARTSIPWTSKIEIECETYSMAKKAMSAGCDIIMCDNMDLDTISNVIEYKNKNFPHILIEVSGNIDKENIEKYKNMQIDAISSGSLIHQAKWIDFSMKFL